LEPILQQAAIEASQLRVTQEEAFELFAQSLAEQYKSTLEQA
jgi:hypothetical protein